MSNGRSPSTGFAETMPRFHHWLLACAVFCPQFVLAQELVVDLNRQENGSNPRYFVEAGDRVFFQADTPVLGKELWVSDGTFDGTHFVRNIALGNADSDARPEVALGNQLVFSTKSPNGVWITDGTTPGTVLLKEFEGGKPGNFLAVGGRVFFSVQVGGGSALWSSDGTPEQTRGVVFQNAEPVRGASSLTVFHDSIFFVTLSADDNNTLWKMDPADGFPKRVFGSEVTVPIQILAADERLYIIGWDALRDRTLWISDGTAGGSSFVADISGSSPSYDTELLCALGDRVLFEANDGVHGYEPWISDGTAAGTMLLADTRPGILGGFPWSPFRLRDEVFFLAYSPESVGRELWRTDGTASGTHLLKDIYPGPSDGYPGPIVEWQGGLLFSANDGVHGEELWISDGTEQGTKLLMDLAPGDGSFGSIARLGTGFLFSGSNGIQGPEPWVSDGTPAGTSMVRNLTQGATASSQIISLADFDGRLYFAADDGISGMEMWQSNGTAEGTKLIVDLYPGAGSSIHNVLGPVGDKLIVEAESDETGPALWAFSRYLSNPSRLTPAETPILYSGNAVTDDVRMMLKVRDELHGPELWTTDGTTEGTRIVKDLNPGPDSSDPNVLGFVNGKWVFQATNANGRGLWVTDGSESGTTRIASLPGSVSGNGVRLASNLVFVAGSPLALWRTNGTQEGTGPFDDRIPASDLTSIGDRAVFFMKEPDVGIVLGETDGTARGTSVVKDIIAGEGGILRELTPAGDRAFLFRDRGLEGLDLWVTDATAEGTRLVETLRYVESAPSPLPLLYAEPYLFFSYDDGEHGMELWATDGTSAGTRMESDICPGPCSSNPRLATRVGDVMYFVATHPDYGKELWRLDLAALGVAVEHQAPRESQIELGPVFPNPFRAAASIEYTLPEPGRVRLVLYDVLGRQVRVLEDADVSSGNHRLSVDAPDLGAGVYFVSMTFDGSTQNRSVVIVR